MFKEKINNKKQQKVQHRKKIERKRKKGRKNK